ncbi:hypothetical protein IFM61606_05030 [Aspergillus udagawae]|uniref:Steroid 5-alpha reductase C-terminal domain-containing protein n=1 Tax=Aspergillus udagawae TaxID=91492 RepID=A0ABQ1B2S2_9EURO|nr:hypothetical protein IFM53868_06933 [Aspergillus udagawae]GFG11510.1 hypothetical protein IFM5058_05476 [Aspergillus udagawae]GFG25100.1 hypothetical protein IFM61606_05030 [Aspergillus udagawae]
MPSKLRDNVSRVKKFNPLGILTFIGLRAADALFQYALLQRGWASSLIELVGATAVNRNLIVRDSTGQLHPYYAIISFMALGSSVKQILNALLVLEQEMSPSSAIAIAFFNTVCNSLNTILSVWVVTTQAPGRLSFSGILQYRLLLAGVGLYMGGILVEAASELQRRSFKKDPTNKGKPYAGGLFSTARHINYGAYTIWRAAYAFTSGGWPWGIAVFSFIFYDFATRGVPVLDKYLLDRYGEQWQAIKDRVPYRLIPGIY